MSKYLCLLMTFVFGSKAYAEACTYKLLSPRYEVAKVLSKNISDKNISLYMDHINNPLVASLFYLSNRGNKMQNALAKKNIEITYRKYQLSAEIIYKDFGFFDFSDATQKNKSLEVRRTIKGIWDFTNFEVAKAIIDNPASFSVEKLAETKAIVSKEILTESGEGLFYLAMFEKQYGNKTIAGGGFLASAEMGFERSILWWSKLIKSRGTSVRSIMKYTSSYCCS